MMPSTFSRPMQVVVAPGFVQRVEVANSLWPISILPSFHIDFVDLEIWVNKSDRYSHIPWPTLTLSSNRGINR